MNLEKSHYYLSRYKHYIIAFLIQLALAGFFIHEWDGFVFITTVSQFLQEGITPYQTALNAPAYTFDSWTQLWYAYPPFPLLLFSATYAPSFLLGGDPIVGRIFLKLGFILGNLLCAYLVYRFVAEVSSEDRALKAEKLVLYNPFLIFIAAVWGMFDIWMVNFLLLSLLSLRHNNWNRAGLFFGLSILVKPILVILVPILLIHAWNKSRRLIAQLLFATCAGGIFVLVSLPFFLPCPDGFITQVAGMHASRPPFGFSPIVILYAGVGLSNIGPISIPSLSIQTISGISAGLLLATIGITAAYYWLQRETREGELLVISFLLVLGFILFNKGVSPQYLVIPIVLVIILLYTYSNYSFITRKDLKRYYGFLVIPYLAASILEGHHYLTFIPTDIALRLMGQSSAELDARIASSFPPYDIIVSALCIVLLVPAMIQAAIILYRGFKKVIPVISEEVSLYLPHLKRVLHRKYITTPTSILVASLFVAMPALGGVAEHCYTDQNEIIFYPQPQGEERLVGTLYYWYDNSSRDPHIRCDSWRNTGLTPMEGFYHSSYGYIKDDIHQMKEAGIDFALLCFDSSNWHTVERYALFAQVAEKEEFYFAPLIDLGVLTDDSSFVAMNPPGPSNNTVPKLSLAPQTSDTIISYIQRALRTQDSPAFLKHEGKPMVFLQGSSLFAPGWSPEEKLYQAQSLIALYQHNYSCSVTGALGMISANWGVDVASTDELLLYYPLSMTGFTQPINKIEQDWSEALCWSWEIFWENIPADAENTSQEKIFWVATPPPLFTTSPLGETAFYTGNFDALFISSPAILWHQWWLSENKQPDTVRNPDLPLNYWTTQISLLRQYSEERDTPIIIAVTPCFDDTLAKPEDTGFGIPLRIGESYSYDLFWDTAVQNNADIVLIASWNHYQESSCIEPTVEFRSTFLEKTRQWTETLCITPTQRD